MKPSERLTAILRKVARGRGVAMSDTAILGDWLEDPHWCALLLYLDEQHAQAPAWDPGCSKCGATPRHGGTIYCKACWNEPAKPGTDALGHYNPSIALLRHSLEHLFNCVAPKNEGHDDSIRWLRAAIDELEARREQDSHRADRASLRQDAHPPPAPTESPASPSGAQASHDGVEKQTEGGREDCNCEQSQKLIALLFDARAILAIADSVALMVSPVHSGGLPDALRKMIKSFEVKLGEVLGGR